MHGFEKSVLKVGAVAVPEIVIDTNILIDAARGDDVAVRFLDRSERESSLSMSIVTYYELLLGCKTKDDLRETTHFSRRFFTLKLSEHISDIASELLTTYRLSHGIEIPDALIAATVISFDLPFATKNIRHFHFIPGINILPYS